MGVSIKISGWGRYPRIDSKVSYFESRRQLRQILQCQGERIVYARGRSYGDSALCERTVFSSRFDKLLDFNADSGLLTCESGVTLGEIVETFLPGGWFLPVTPGTRFVSVGGAVAGDVHGKNHHTDGCFTQFVDWLDLMLPSGEVARCSRDENVELFRATCGGMGLTGVILETRLRLRRARSGLVRQKVVPCLNLREVLQQFEENAGASYSVAWIDCLARGDDLGRSILFLGEHADSGKLDLPAHKPLRVLCDVPSFVLNRSSIALFNSVYYRKQAASSGERLVPLSAFFYPLDGIQGWNRMYGAAGFLQYQVVLPRSSGNEGLEILLGKAAEAGLGSFLAVLKLFGAENDNLLSFPMEGYTLALDFKATRQVFGLLDELDRIVLDHGGRGYLCKDSRMGREAFRRGYPRWERFAAIRERYGLRDTFQSLQSRRLGV
ncbi:MAG: FAD-binding protein [Syntrophobacteraceae bacterium]